MAELPSLQSKESWKGPSVAACHLCGLPLGRSSCFVKIREETYPFCCRGCLAVFQILRNRPEGFPENFRESDLYRACVESGILPGEKTESPNPSASSSSPDEAGLSVDLSFRIDGMWCTACSWVIEEVLKKTKGVVEVKVHFLSDLVQLKYLPHRLNPRDIFKKVSSLGYRPFRIEDESIRREEKRRHLIRLGISSLLTANLMMISLALYAGFFYEVGQDTIQYLSYPIALLSTVVVFYGGFPIIKQAGSTFRSGVFTMDILIAVGSLSAYAYSFVQLMQGSLHLYFDTASMLITLVLLGRHIERHSRDKVSQGIIDLYAIAHQKARLAAGDRERWVSPESVRIGDLFLVRTGERNPLDGRIVEGSATVDESLLTGESRPRKKTVRDEILAGALLLEGDLKIETTRVGRESSLGQMVELIQEALLKKNPFEQLADRLMRGLIPAILLLAAGTVLCLLASGSSREEALLRAVTVIVITCPCALGIASPLAKVAVIGKARTEGILIRNPEAFEKVRSLDVLVFDKTGTLTQGAYLLREIVLPGVSTEAALSLLASVEVHSDHYLAREVVRFARDYPVLIKDAEEFKSLEGSGVTGKVEGEEVFLGNRVLLTQMGLPLPPEFDQKARLHEEKGMTSVFCGWKGKVRGFLVFGDTLKESASETVEQLRRQGMELWILSGDGALTTGTIAKELKIESSRGQTLPQDKVEIIRSLQRQGKRVGMVGDGLNDAAGLAQADVGFSMGTRGNLTREVSDITLLDGNPAKLLSVIRLSGLARRIIRQNLFFSLFYNGLAIPLAILGILNPLIAVTAMFVSSLSVIANTLRITARNQTAEAPR